jgi:murein DD-endopeptidase MepM/ murein hydrolase activator NlpD
MNAESEDARQRMSRARIAAALLSAGVVVNALSGSSPLAAGEPNAPVVTTVQTTASPAPADPPPTSTTPAPTPSASPPPIPPSDPGPPPAPPSPGADPAPAAPDPAMAAASTAPAPPAAAPTVPAPTPPAPTEPPRALTPAPARAPAGGRARRTPPPPARHTGSPGRGGALDVVPRTVLRNAQGVPTMSNPTTSLAVPGPAAIGVPNFFIDKFRIPVFLLPIYQAAATQYDVRWEILAAINEIETDYGRNLNVSSAGALGWMQFMPQTWKHYGVDANHDGHKDPFNPVDAIFAAARYLKAAGAQQNLRNAIFAYNHADWYVNSVLMRARLIGGLPADLVGSLSGLTQGQFPVYAQARYADDIAERNTTRRIAIASNTAKPIVSDAARRGVDIFAAAGSPVIAVQDGRIIAAARNKRLGNFVRLTDPYGNTYTYAHLKKIAARIAVPKARTQSRASIAKELSLPKADPKPTLAASAGKPTHHRPKLGAPAPRRPATTSKATSKERLFAHPARTNARPNGGAQQLLELESRLGKDETLKSYLTGDLGLGEKDVVLLPLTAGRRVIAGTILGRIGTTSKTQSPHVHFEIKPAGRGAPSIDPKPILDGWKLLDATAIYRANDTNPLARAATTNTSIGQIMLMSKDALARRVLSNPRVEIYSCGRRDIRSGTIDRRVLATLEFLAASGLRPTVTSLHCGHSYYTTAGNISEHSAGSAVDIAMINRIPILGHQGQGSIADITIRRLLTLQGTMKPHQIISLMTYPGTDNTLALADHADHIHIGFHPEYTPGSAAAKELAAVLKPSQWVKLIDRLGHIANPTVARKPSRYALDVRASRGSAEHEAESPRAPTLP